MTKNKAQTTSFVVRFTQKIFDDEKGEPNVQWRGNISHVQGGDQKKFTDFQDAVAFIQTKLADLTLESTGDKSKEEQEGILAKSFEMWKKMATEGPKMVIEAIKDPKKQVAQFQDQIIQVQDEISHKIEFDDWRSATKSDYKHVMDALEYITLEVAKLNGKVDELSKKST